MQVWYCAALVFAGGGGSSGRGLLSLPRPYLRESIFPCGPPENVLAAIMIGDQRILQAEPIGDSANLAPSNPRSANSCNCQHHHSQRKPLAKSRSEKRPTLNVQNAGNTLSQWATHATSVANLGKSRHNSVSDIFSRNIRD